MVIVSGSLLHPTPLVFATTGGMGREAIVFYRRLADLLSHKNNMICDCLCENQPSSHQNLNSLSWPSL